MPCLILGKANAPTMRARKVVLTDWKHFSSTMADYLQLHGDSRTIAFAFRSEDRGRR